MIQTLSICHVQQGSLSLSQMLWDSVKQGNQTGKQDGDNATVEESGEQEIQRP
jgi:hypothetical protein